MRGVKMAGLLLAAATMTAGCASDRYGYNDNRTLRSAGTGAAIGAAGGAAVGALVDGVGVAEGAAIGAVVGGVAGAATAGSGDRWYRDDRGRCYRVDNRGYRVYDRDRRC